MHPNWQVHGNPESFDPNELFVSGAGLLHGNGFPVGYPALFDMNGLFFVPAAGLLDGSRFPVGIPGLFDGSGVPHYNGFFVGVPVFYLTPTMPGLP